MIPDFLKYGKYLANNTNVYRSLSRTIPQGEGSTATPDLSNMSTRGNGSDIQVGNGDGCEAQDNYIKFKLLPVLNDSDDS